MGEWLSARAGCVARSARRCALSCFIKNNSDGNRMKSRSAFEFTVRRCCGRIRSCISGRLRSGKCILREESDWVESVSHALKAQPGISRGASAGSTEQDCHFHVITNRRFPIRKFWIGEAVRVWSNRDESRNDQAVRYLCKYLSKSRVAFERTGRHSVKSNELGLKMYSWTHRKFGCCAGSWGNGRLKMN